MKDLASKAKYSTQAMEGTSVEREKIRVEAFINDDVCSSILDVSFRRMLKKAVQSGAAPVEPLELWNNELDVKVDFSQYRSKLVCRRSGFYLWWKVFFHIPVISN